MYDLTITEFIMLVLIYFSPIFPRTPWSLLLFLPLRLLLLLGLTLTSALSVHDWK
jgi:hypothetical protein